MAGFELATSPTPRVCANRAALHPELLFSERIRYQGLHLGCFKRTGPLKQVAKVILFKKLQEHIYIQLPGNLF